MPELTTIAIIAGVTLLLSFGGLGAAMRILRGGKKKDTQ